MSEKLGMAIYCDIDRELTDTLKFDNENQAWLPGNRAAHKLFRCVECIRDIRSLLEAASGVEAEKRQRLVKNLYTPLNSLAGCLFDLLDHCEGNPETVKMMPKDGTKQIPPMKKLLNEHLPLGKNGLLSLLRNKTAAHVDDSLHASEARDLHKRAAIHEVGFWIHVCITVFCDLLKLPIYFWTCPSKHPGVSRIMMAEPFLHSMKIDADGTFELLESRIADSPRNEIKILILHTFRQSRWMFRPEDRQIRSFSFDRPGDSWAQSLEKPVPLPRASLTQ